MSAKTQKTPCPPYGNTGGTHTNKTGLRACVDWVAVTFKNLQEPEKVVGVLGLDIDNFTYYGFGGKYYRQKIKYGHITIFFDGVGADQGVHLEITGQGCREYEQFFTGQQDWSLFFALLYNWDVTFSRLDIAIDDFKGYFTLKQILDKIKTGQVKSLFKKSRSLEEYLLKDGSLTGHTIYFGKSDVIFRFYNKYLQMIGQGKTLSDDVQFWNRYEIQLRDDRANTAANLIAFKHTDVGDFAKGVFAQYLNFLVDNGDSNKWRWPVAPFWRKFLDNCGKIGLTQVAPDRTIERLENWFNRQVAPSLAALYKAYNYDDKKIMRFIKDGMDRLTSEQEDMIKRYQINNKRKQKIVDDIKILKMRQLFGDKADKYIERPQNKKTATPDQE